RIVTIIPVKDTGATCGARIELVRTRDRCGCAAASRHLANHADRQPVAQRTTVHRYHADGRHALVDPHHANRRHDLRWQRFALESHAAGRYIHHEVITDPDAVLPTDRDEGHVRRSVERIVLHQE